MSLHFLNFYLFIHLSGCIWRRQWHPTPVLLPGKPHGQRSLVGCSPWGRIESDTTEATEQQQHQVFFVAYKIFSAGSFFAADRLSSCGVRAQLSGPADLVARECGILVPQSGIEPMTPALQGRFLTTGPPGKSIHFFSKSPFSVCSSR